MNIINGFYSINLRNRLTVLRQPLMGFAIIWIFMLHSGRTGNPIWDAVRLYGWSGVDMFFFLSAIGLCYSLNKNSDIKDFYKRRAYRILPTWMIVLLAVHLMGLVCNHFLPKVPFYIPDSILKCFTWYTGLGYWISDFVTGKGWYYEWYVPSLLIFYLFTPFLYKKKKWILIAILGSILAIGFLLNYCKILHHLHFFYLRIPIFVLGLLYYRLMIFEDNKMFNKTIISSFVIGIGILLCNLLLNTYVPKEHIALFLCPPFLIVISFLISYKYIRNCLAFFGGISLELYLIHLYRRPHYLVSFVFENKFLIIIVSFILCTILAALLQRLVSRVVKR